VFISHSWKYSDHYDKLVEWVFEKSWNSNGTPIIFENVSVPEANLILYTRNDRELYDAILQRIALAHVVVIPVGLYATYSKWIQKEIDGSAALGVPILAVTPWAQERKSRVAEAANRVVGWSSKSVVQGIWELK
jgi:hypothetical protein